MEIAKGTDLPDLLTHLGYQVRRLGSYYSTKEMDSIRIKDRRTWKRYSNGTGGDAITFLQEFCGKDFREAVNYLLEFNGGRARDSPTPRPRQAQASEKPAFTLPIPNQDQRRVFAYLQKRGIAPQVIRGFIDSGLLYEDGLHLVVAKSAQLRFRLMAKIALAPLLLLSPPKPLRWVLAEPPREPSAAGRVGKGGAAK